MGITISMHVFCVFPRLSHAYKITVLNPVNVGCPTFSYAAFPASLHQVSEIRTG